MKVRLKQEPEEDPRFYKMLSKVAGKCECEQDIRLSELIVWDSEEKKAYCYDCGIHLL